MRNSFINRMPVPVWKKGEMCGQARESAASVALKEMETVNEITADFCHVCGRLWA